MSEKILSECEECQWYQRRSLLEKINTRFQIGLEHCKSWKNGTGKYGIHYFVQAFWYETWADEGKTCVKEYENAKCTDEEHAIFIINWKKREKLDKKFYVYGSGVDLLVEFLNKKNVKFKIYNCFDPDFFIDAIKKSKAQYLWIFAHGDRHGVDFGGVKGYVSFCKLAGTQQRKFIAQSHCSHLTGKTMWEYLSNEPGIFCEGIHTAIQNRELIRDWIQKNDKTE